MATCINPSPLPNATAIADRAHVHEQERGRDYQRTLEGSSSLRVALGCSSTSTILRALGSARDLQSQHSQTCILACVLLSIHHERLLFFVSLNDKTTSLVTLVHL